MIAPTVRTARAIVPHIIVVDDCSSDATSQEARQAGALVCTHPINMGQGAALQTGIEYALLKGAEWIVTFDADGQHDANEILPMLEALIQSNAKIALGSRFLGKSINMPRQRRLLLKMAILFARLTGGGHFSDAHNGFRIMHRSFAEQFEFRQNRMAHASEIQNFIARNHVPYIEFPVTISYTEYSLKKGQKSSNAIRVLIELFTDWVSR